LNLRRATRPKDQKKFIVKAVTIRKYIRNTYNSAIAET